MMLDDLQKVIEKLRSRVERHRDYLHNSEFRTRTLLIDPLLRELGWDVENPNLVALEDQPASSKRDSADYILKSSGKNVAIVEAKNIDKKIDDLDHREQADNYARDAGVQFFVLTNGVIWLLYERSLTTSFELLEPIVRFDIVHDEAYHCALASISMWNPNLASGSPKEAMKPVLDPLPDKIEDGSIPPGPAPVIDADGIVTFDGKTFKAIDDDWTGKKIGAFMFEDNTYKAKNGKDFFIKFFEILSKDKTLQFREVLDLNKAFSKDPDTFPPSAKQQRTDIMEIGKTGIHFNAHRDHERNKEIIISVVEHFECDMPIPLEEAD